MHTATTTHGETLTHYPLGAIWPVAGIYHGPSIGAGADGSRVKILRATAGDGRSLTIAVASPNLGVTARIREIMLDALPSAKIVESYDYADDVASCTLVATASAPDHCAGTGVVTQPVGEDGHLKIVGVYIDETHEWQNAWTRTPDSVAFLSQCEAAYKIRRAAAIAAKK